MAFDKVVGNMMVRALKMIAAPLMVLSMLAAQVEGAEVVHRSNYSISLGILQIARADFTTRLNNQNYAISANFTSAGLASILKDISGKTTISGVKTPNRMQANAFSLFYRDGSKSRTYDVKLRGGNVTSSTITPAPKTRPDDWVQVRERDLRAVLDPISGLIFPEKAKVCSGRLPVYDGESRMDLILSPAGTKPFKTSGFAGEAIVCNIKYSPRSGYRKGRKDIEYLKSITMEVWFAKADSVGVYAPVYARIPTRVGQVHIKATRYGG